MLITYYYFDNLVCGIRAFDNIVRGIHIFDNIVRGIREFNAVLIYFYKRWPKCSCELFKMTDSRAQAAGCLVTCSCYLDFSLKLPTAGMQPKASTVQLPILCKTYQILYHFLKNNIILRMKKN